MSNKNEIAVKLIVNDDGSVTMKQFGKTTEEAMNKAEVSAKKANSTFASLKGSYLEFTAKAASAYLAITKAMEYMDQGAKAEQAEASFRTLAAAAGESADAIIANMKRATNETIDDSAMMQSAAKAMLLEFNGDQIVKMAEAARLAARTSGEDVVQVFDNIVNAISTNMPRSLKQYGLITKEQMTIINQAMAEGVEGIDLYSLAIANLAVQQDKMGPLVENEAEKLQKYKAQIEDLKESFGKLLTVMTGKGIEDISKVTEPFAALAASISTGSTAPMEAYLKKLAEIKDVVEKTAEANKNAADEEKRRKENAIKQAQIELAQKKSSLETMKALNKDYFTSQEAQIKAMSDLMNAAGADEYKISQDAIRQRETLNAEFYTRTKAEIELEAAARQKSDRDKISDAAYVAQKMQALDAETASKAIALIRQKTLSSVQAAQSDIAGLTTRLGEYQTYYDSLKAKMDQNIADEKKHLEELKALRQQSVDIDKSTAALIAGIKGTDASLSAQQKYDSARSGLNSQYGSALDMTGQDQIKALEEYKQAVAALQAQYSTGIPGVKNIFGNVDEIISAKTIAEDAISDIERATQMQKNALAQLAEEKQAQIAADQLWGQTLQAEAQKAQGEMEKLKGLIADISAQIQAMQTTIELTGVDHVTSVVDGIIARIEQLHNLARQPISLGGSGSYAASAGSYASGNTGLYGSGWDTSSTWVQDSYAEGTPYVPKTGLYQLHQGEAVVPASENKAGRSVNIGDIVINVPAGTQAGSPEDWRMIVRNYIVPEIRKLSS